VLGGRIGIMGFNSAEDLQDALRSMDPCDFVSTHLFESIPTVFENRVDLWIQWKKRLASFLEVDPYEMVLTGSGAIGYSLSPYKNYRKYHDKSDIDVAVISSHHFETAWRYLRQSRTRWLSISRQAKIAIEEHRKNYVFTGTIATDSFLALLPFGKRWQNGLDEMGTHAPTVGRDVKLRIYRDYDALRYYHMTGIKRLQEALLSSTEDQLQVETEED
jgi:hypothetical protein